MPVDLAESWHPMHNLGVPVLPLLDHGARAVVKRMSCVLGSKLAYEVIAHRHVVLASNWTFDINDVVKILMSPADRNFNI